MDGFEDMEMDLSSLLDDFPPDLSSGGDTDMVASPLGDLFSKDLFSPLGEGFHPKALAELLGTACIFPSCQVHSVVVIDDLSIQSLELILLVLVFFFSSPTFPLRSSVSPSQRG